MKNVLSIALQHILFFLLPVFVVLCGYLFFEKNMKILHTADWHLGKRLEQFSRLQEQRDVMNEIGEIAEQEDVDAIIVAGDLYDTANPSTEATELFYKTVKRLSNNGLRPVIAISGNHDSPERIEAPDPLAKECGIMLVGYPQSEIVPFSLETGFAVTKSDVGFVELKLPKTDVPLRLLLTPYVNEYRLQTYLGDDEAEGMRNILTKQWKHLAETYCDEKGVNMLVAHLLFAQKRDEIPEEPDDEKPILHVGGAEAIWSECVPQGIDYVALGHLHRFQQIAKQPCPMVYSSSPLAYSMSEASQTKAVVIIESEGGHNIDYKKRDLVSGKKLLKKKCHGVNEAVTFLNDNPNALVELTVVSETFLTAEERKRIQDAHDGIVAIIPEVKNAQTSETNASRSIDLDKNIYELFEDYFEYKHGQKVNEEMKDLFKEILSI